MAVAYGAEETCFVVSFVYALTLGNAAVKFCDETAAVYDTL
jgi:hypothetical protein